MTKLTIKSGCVEAQFKRGRERTKSLEREKANFTELPLAAGASVQPTVDAELEAQDSSRTEATSKTTLALAPRPISATG